MKPFYSVILSFLLGFALAACLWQLEILEIVATTGAFEYNFGGLGNMGYDWWSWRDVWFFSIFALMLSLLVLVADAAYPTTT